MQTFKPDTDVPVTFQLVDESGASLAPTLLRWRVLDSNDSVLLNWAVVTLTGSPPSVSVTVPAINTALVVGELRGLRLVQLEVTSPIGVVVLEQAFLIQGETSLVFGSNTFQTYAKALLLSTEFVSGQLPGWEAASRAERESALTQAYSRLMLAPIWTRSDADNDDQSRLTPDLVISQYGGLLRHATLETLQNLQPRLIAALRNAQIVEANETLANDPIAAARAAGLISMTVGESSQFFSSSKTLDLPICDRAMAYLQPWIRIRAGLGRS
jgi:hypothetical protein